VLETQAFFFPSKNVFLQNKNLSKEKISKNFFLQKKMKWYMKLALVIAFGCLLFVMWRLDELEKKQIQYGQQLAQCITFVELKLKESIQKD
jgi:hypothetical protein